MGGRRRVLGLYKQCRLFAANGKLLTLLELTYLITFRFSILPALSLDGILDMRVIEGSVNSELFLGFIEGLLMEMNPFPGRNSVLVMDNVKFHHHPAVRFLCESRYVLFFVKL
jgi:hypothetical protein